MGNCKIDIDSTRKSLKIYGDFATRDKILRHLLKKDFFVKDHHSFLNPFLELDYSSLKALKEDGQISNELPDNIDSEIAREISLKSELEDNNYDLDLRIWNEGNTYCCEVENDIYSCNDLSKFISFLNGEFLIESNKPHSSLSTNPFAVFGVFNVAKDFLDPNKTTIHLKTKKQFQPLRNKTNSLKIVIDGADDTANAMNNTGLPQQTVALMQGLLIFPLFLKGVNLGYEGLKDETLETFEEYKSANFRRVEIEVKIEQFKKDLCDKCGIPYSKSAPAEFLKTISQGITKTNKNEIAKLVADYQQELAKELELDTPEITDVLAASCGWMAMTSMMTSVAVYEGQALFNIFGGIKNITSGGNALFSTIGASAGLGGQILMTFYALHKMQDEGKEWAATEEELQKFRGAKNINELARKISEELLTANRDNHRTQYYGNAALALGQALMATSGAISFAAPPAAGVIVPPALFTGLGLTIGGIAVNSFSELKFQTSYQIDEDCDDLERQIITRPPRLEKADFRNLGAALAKDSEQKILELEILGHLRAPQLLLYQKFSKEDKGLGGSFGFLADKLLNKSPTTTTDLIKDNDLIAARHPNDLDVFNVEQSDLDEALAQYHLHLTDRCSSTKAVQILLEDFIRKKSHEAQIRPKKTTKDLCKSIIKKGGAAGDYLTKKLMRAVANGEINYSKSLTDDAPKITKNGRKITVAKLNIEDFEEADLEKFLTHKRPKKTILGGKKNPALAQANNQQIYTLKSDHLRPFSQISKLSNAASGFVDHDLSRPPEPPISGHLQPLLAAPNQQNFTRKNTVFSRQNSSSTITSTDENQPETEQNLLTKFASFATKNVSENKEERKKQLKQQNQIIDEVLTQTKPFKLVETINDQKKNKTIFVYADPNCIDPKDPDYQAKQVIYIRDNISGKIDALYGEKSQAFIVERPNEQKNGVIIKVDENKIERYGQSSNSVFQSFKKLEKNSPPPWISSTKFHPLNTNNSRDHSQYSA